MFSGMKKKDDRVEKAIKERKLAGNYLTVVPNAETHEPLAKAFKLSLKQDYKLQENKMNKEMQKLRAREATVSKSPTRSNKRSPKKKGLYTLDQVK